MTREALKLALEALEVNNKAWKHLADSGDAGFWEAEEQPFYELSVKAITGIREALAQQEQDNGKLKVTLEDTPTEIELAQYKRMFEATCADLGAINEALGLDPNDGGAEPIIFAIEELKGRSQEPVGWMVYTLDGASVCVTDNPTDFTPEHRALPLFTVPPQRKPLTDEEIRDALEAEFLHSDGKRNWQDDLRVARAIEAKLKEKNT
jgi:hypothetical protein